MTLWPVQAPSLWWQIGAALVIGVTGALVMVGAAAVVGMIAHDWRAWRQRRGRNAS